MGRIYSLVRGEVEDINVNYKLDSDLKLFLLASGTLRASGISTVGEGAYIQERCALSVR